MATQNCADWKPKPRQKRILEAAQEVGLNRTITTVCEEADVPRRTFYYWLDKDPCFADAWDKVWRRAITRHMPTIIAAVVCKARKGDVPAARLLADMVGAVKQVHEVSSTDDVSIILTWDDDEAEPDASEAP